MVHRKEAGWYQSCKQRSLLRQRIEQRLRSTGKVHREAFHGEECVFLSLVKKQRILWTNLKSQWKNQCSVASLGNIKIPVHFWLTSILLVFYNTTFSTKNKLALKFWDFIWRHLCLLLIFFNPHPRIVFHWFVSERVEERMERNINGQGEVQNPGMCPWWGSNAALSTKTNQLGLKLRYF